MGASRWITTRVKSEQGQMRAGREKIKKVFANHVKYMRLHARKGELSLWVVSKGMAGSSVSPRNCVRNEIGYKEAGRHHHRPV